MSLGKSRKFPGGNPEFSRETDIVVGLLCLLESGGDDQVGERRLMQDHAGGDDSRLPAVIFPDWTNCNSHTGLVAILTGAGKPRDWCVLQPFCGWFFCWHGHCLVGFAKPRNHW